VHSYSKKKQQFLSTYLTNSKAVYVKESDEDKAAENFITDIEDVVSVGIYAF
jgi:hypothetical protein